MFNIAFAEYHLSLSVNIYMYVLSIMMKMVSFNLFNLSIIKFYRRKLNLTRDMSIVSLWYFLLITKSIPFSWRTSCREDM